MRHLSTTTIAVSALAAAWMAGCSCDSQTPGGPNDADASADAGPSDAAEADGGAACPPYQKRCSGTCVLTGVDPAHCGDCDTPCLGALACSGGTCSSTCRGDLDICQNRCVDLHVDNQHCGSCDRVCPAGTGCVGSDCHPVADGGPGPATCPPSGPLYLAGSDGGTAGCLGSLAQTTFRWSLCSCTDITVTARLETDAFDSATGSYTPGGAGGGVGLNGAFTSSAQVDVGGSLWASASNGLRSTAQARVAQELRVGGPFSTSAAFAVGLDAYAAGDVSTSSSVAIAGALHLPASAGISGAVTTGSVVREPVSVSPPCDCTSAQLVPVAEIVAARRAANDNATIGLLADALQGVSAATRLDLPCGHYYLTGIDASAALAIVVHGRAALYVDGDVQTSADLRVVTDPGVELDVFVAGGFSTTATTVFGALYAPALNRLYLGGSSEVSLTGGLDFGGYLYAAKAPVVPSSALEIYGGVYAGDFQSSGPTTIHYDSAVLGVGDSCSQPGPSGCTSCRDCGNQACVAGTCQACTSSDQCCSPLACRNGRCRPLVQ